MSEPFPRSYIFQRQAGFPHPTAVAAREELYFSHYLKLVKLSNCFPISLGMEEFYLLSKMLDSASSSSSVISSTPYPLLPHILRKRKMHEQL